MSTVEGNPGLSAKPIQIQDRDEVAQELQLQLLNAQVAYQQSYSGEPIPPHSGVNTLPYVENSLTGNAQSGQNYAAYRPIQPKVLPETEIQTLFVKTDDIPEVFKNLKTVLKGKDVESTQKHFAILSLLSNHKNGNDFMSAHAASLLYELLNA